MQDLVFVLLSMIESSPSFCWAYTRRLAFFHLHECINTTTEQDSCVGVQI